MATELQNYGNLKAAKEDKVRGGKRHKAGWRPLQTNFNPNGTVTILWSNDPEPPPPPKRQLTQIDFIKELAEQNNVELLGVGNLEPMTIKGKKEVKSLKKWWQFWK